MRIGTKSVLFGAHQFLIHPLFVAVAWWRLHGFRRVEIGSRTVWREVELNDRESLRRAFRRTVFTSLFDPRLWIAFFVHDLGYVGKPNMDGPEGELHPQWGAALMHRWFGEPWFEFVYYHSRFLAKQNRQQPSVLCLADKLAGAMEPWWLYLPRVNLTGEIHEYMSKSGRMASSKYNGETVNKYESMQLEMGSQRAWHSSYKSYVRRYVAEHKDGRPDTWTPDVRQARDAAGVWQ